MLKSGFYFKSTSLTSSILAIQPDFPQNQPAVITLVNTGYPRTLVHPHWMWVEEKGWDGSCKTSRASWVVDQPSVDSRFLVTVARPLQEHGLGLASKTF
jgi:hypothetical protein